MIHPHDAIREFIKEKKRLYDLGHVEPLELLEKYQWESLFDLMCKNRMLIGAYRYTSQETQRKNFNHTDYIQSMKAHIKEYEKDGNVEHLFDISNNARIEFGVANRYQTFVSEDDKMHGKAVK